MSEFGPYKERLDMQEQIARIERGQAETRKFVAEQAKLSTEQAKFGAEQAKLFAEASNLRVIRVVTPIAVLVGTAASLIAAAPVLLRLLPGH